MAGKKVLRDGEVHKLRAVHQAGGISVRELGKRFGISKSQVQRIISNQQRKEQIRRPELW